MTFEKFEETYLNLMLSLLEAEGDADADRVAEVELELEALKEETKSEWLPRAKALGMFQ